MAKAKKTIYDDEAVQAATAKLNEMRAELTACHRRMSELGARVELDGAARREALGDAAEALLAGGTVEAVDEDALRGEMRTLTTRARVLHEAERRAKARLDVAMDAANRDHLAGEADQHRKLAERVNEASDALEAAVAAYKAWRDELEAAGYTLSVAFEPPPGCVMAWRLEGQTFGKVDQVRSWCERVTERRVAA